MLAYRIQLNSLCCCFILLVCPLIAIKAQYQISPLKLESPILPARMDRISESSDGFFWIGGGNGLFSVDGVSAQRIRIYDPNAGIVHNQIVQSSMFEDSKGGLWFSTYSALHRLQLNTREVTTLQIKSNGIPLRSDYRPFHFDSTRQELWLRAGDILWAYNVNTSAYRPLSNETSAVDYTTSMLANGRVRVFGARWIFKGLELVEFPSNGKPGALKTLATNENVVCSLPINADSILLGTQNGLKLLTLSADSAIIENFPCAAEDNNTVVTSLLFTT